MVRAGARVSLSLFPEMKIKNNSIFFIEDFVKLKYSIYYLLYK